MLYSELHTFGVKQPSIKEKQRFKPESLSAAIFTRPSDAAASRRDDGRWLDNTRAAWCTAVNADATTIKQRLLETSPKKPHRSF